MLMNNEFEQALAAQYGYTLVGEDSEEVKALINVYKGQFAFPWFSYENVKHAKRVVDVNNGKEVKADFKIFDGKCCFIVDGVKHSLSRFNMTFQCPVCVNEHIMCGNPSRRRQKRGLLCERCYKSRFYTTSQYQERYTATMLARHNVKRPLQNTDIQAKFVNTCRKKHGVSYPMMSQNVRERHKNNMRANHGRSNWFEGLNAHTMWPREYGFSSLEEEFALEFTKHFLNEKIYSCLNRQFYVLDVREGWCYSLDIYMPTRDLVVEVYGDYWHANPEVYNDNHLLHSGKTAENIQAKDIIRRERIERKLQCRVMIVWEKDLRLDIVGKVATLAEMIKNG